jgi:hypothetical protein
MDGSQFSEGGSVVKRVALIVIAIVAGCGGIGYAIYEHHDAQNLVAQNEQVTAQLKATHGQLDALAAKVNELAASSQAKPAQPPAPVLAAPSRPSAAHRSHAQDQRFSKLQSQIDSQGKAIDDTRNNLENTRTELTGSIARTHDDLVLLQKKGERNYYEFDIQKAKDFKRIGPVNVSLRKANTKRQYADLALIVEDRNLTQKHVNLYQPVMFYRPDSPQPVEIVINDISKDHIHGYISAPKYRQSELASASDANANPAPGTDQAANSGPHLSTRQKLPLPGSSSDQQ